MASILNSADIILQQIDPRLVQNFRLPSNLAFTGNIASTATIAGGSTASQIVTPTNPITPTNKDNYLSGAIIDSSRIQNNQVTIINPYTTTQGYNVNINYPNLDVVTINGNYINLNGIQPQIVSVIVTVAASNDGNATNVYANLGWEPSGGSFTSITGRAFSVPQGLTSCVTMIYTFVPGTVQFRPVIKWGNNANGGGPWRPIETAIITIVSIR